jgi:hypothetical protein
MLQQDYLEIVQLKSCCRSLVDAGLKGTELYFVLTWSSLNIALYEGTVAIKSSIQSALCCGGSTGE